MTDVTGFWRQLLAKDDASLVRAMLDGEKTVYAQLYDRYARLIRAICYDTTGDLGEAQDLAQDVFLRAYEKLGKLRDPNHFSAWLVGIAKMRCREWKRQHCQDQHRYADLEIDKLVAGQVPDDSRLEPLRAAIMLLPEKQRLAVHALYLQEMSAEKARRILGLSRSGFYRVLDRARKRLERLVREKQEDFR